MKLAIRSMFTAPKDSLLISWDLSQAESWVVAYLANEPRMKESLNNGDIHTDTAIALSGLNPANTTNKDWKVIRYKYKRANHAFAYRMSWMRYVQVINQDSDQPPFVTITNEEGKRNYAQWHGYYLLQNWWSSIEYKLSVDRTLTGPYGNPRTFFAPWGNELFKEATAHVPQSTVALHLNGAVQPEVGICGGLREVWKRYGKSTLKIVNQSHDSFIAEFKGSDYKEIAESVAALLRRPIQIGQEQFTIPVSCEVGERWGELEEVKV